MRSVTSIALVLLLACRESPNRRMLGEETAFAAVQARGDTAMGVDQYTSTHLFEALPDGGRVELQRDRADSAGAAQIRRHMRTIAAAFATGDFRFPGFVHDRQVPGTDVMAARRVAITYTVESLPQGGALRLRTSDPVAVRAIHEFLAFQRLDRRADAHARTMAAPQR